MKLKTWMAGVVLGVVAVACQPAAWAQDPLKLLPNNYNLIFENDQVLVIRAHYGAHEKIPVHDHTAFAAIFVYLNNAGQVRIDHAEAGEDPVSVVRPPTVKGSYRVAEGIAERHSIENLGDSSSDFLRVELKRAPLQLKEPFRGKAPQDLTHSVDVLEFNTPAVEIERIVCVGVDACQIKPAPAASLLLALTSSSLDGASAANVVLSPGAVRWLPSSEALTVRSDAASPAHLLRILLPSAK